MCSKDPGLTVFCEMELFRTTILLSVLVLSQGNIVSSNISTLIVFNYIIFIGSFEGKYGGCTLCTSNTASNVFYNCLYELLDNTKDMHIKIVGSGVTFAFLLCFNITIF